jgi:para-nitrobenzyl esterase
MFDHLGQESWAWSDDDRRLADTMARYWVNFARSGDPNGADLAAWPVFQSEGGQVLILDAPVSVAPAPMDRQLRVFDTVYDQVRGAPGPR